MRQACGICYLGVPPKEPCELFSRTLHSSQSHLSAHWVDPAGGQAAEAQIFISI